VKRKIFIRLFPFIIFCTIAIPIFVISNNKAMEAWSLFSDNGIMQFYDIYMHYMWIAVLAIFITALVVIPVYNLIIGIIYRIKKLYIFICSLMLGIIMSIFLYYISAFNDSKSSDVQIVYWVYFLVAIIIHSYSMGRIIFFQKQKEINIGNN